MKRKHIIINHRNAALLALALATGNALAVDGTWNVNTSSTWAITSNWLSGTVADGVGATATVSAAFTSNRTITLDTSRTIGILNLNATNRNTTVAASGGSVLILDNTGVTNAQINVPASPNQNELIDAPIQLQDSLTITNAIPAGNKSLSLGAISSTNGALTISNTSAIHATTTSTRFNGIISDGTSGNSVSLNNLAGLAGISNAANTFSGSTTVTGGVLRIEHATALQNSPLNTTGSIAGDANNGFRINTGITALTLGGLTGNKNLAATGGVITTTSGGYGAVTALTLNPGTGMSHSYDGVIENGAVGGMTLTKSGAGTQTLNGTNLYTGTTTVSGGTLALGASGSIATSPTIIVGASTTLDVSAVSGGFTLGAAQTLSGTGTVSGAMTVAGTLSPGNSPGSITTGSQTWIDGGDYNFQMLDATGVAGTGFDQIAVTGTLDLSSLTAGGFNINLLSLSSIGPDVSGDALNFNNALTQSWIILTTTGGITGFDAADFALNTGGFTNAFAGGGFSLGTASNNLVLNFTAIPEPSAVLLGGLGVFALLRRRRG